LVNSRRATASSCILELSQIFERGFIAGNTFIMDVDGDGSSEGAGETLGGQCVNDLTTHYDFKITKLTKTEYTLTAAPRPAQYDPACESLSMDQRGKLTVSSNAEKDAKYCWNK